MVGCPVIVIQWPRYLAPPPGIQSHRQHWQHQSLPQDVYAMSLESNEEATNKCDKLFDQLNMIIQQHKSVNVMLGSENVSGVAQ